MTATCQELLPPFVPLWPHMSAVTGVALGVGLARAASICSRRSRHNTLSVGCSYDLPLCVYRPAAAGEARCCCCLC